MSRLENVLDDPLPIDDSFPDEQLASINVFNKTAHYANYIVAKYLPPRFTCQQKKKILYYLRHYFWDDPHLYKEGVDGIIRCCVPEHEQGKSYRNVTPKLMEGIMRETEVLTRYYNLGFIGLPFSRMLISLSHLVMNVKE